MAIDQIPLPALSPDFHVIALGYLAMALLQQGQPDQARLRLQQAADRGLGRESPFERGFAAQVGCVIALTLRNMEGLATSGEQAMAFDDFPPIAAAGIEAYRATGQRPALPSLLAMPGRYQFRCGPSRHPIGSRGPRLLAAAVAFPPSAVGLS